MRPMLFSLAMLASSYAASGATAGERFSVVEDYGYGGGYGFAGEAIGGAYIGAPLTRFPRPNEIVPPAWGYGTYGVPTITGIRQAPAGEPTLTVINSRDTAPRRGSSAVRHASRDGQGQWTVGSSSAQPSRSGVRVISVTVPHR
ncbi:hypothetical protein [Methylobacterium gnaphalii]|nr:hypothetical protein [Methylobacterium gnaphalii]GJD69192.1 hypothetical protein MMMDOFMJ_2119 [Methylobacterium gnaphalii]